MRGVHLRVRGPRDAPFDPQVQPRVPPQVHRRVARVPRHLPGLSGQPEPGSTGPLLVVLPVSGFGSRCPPVRTGSGGPAERVRCRR
ncbi:unnamed protein product [Linum tenue]|uniref:Uncharacterized protein n=1 Tax=Linum tenue TaxID=586396 RepID=A0AAV0MPJ2_9ROSI|nr:unnamed protein product [Linum tenue]